MAWSLKCQLPVGVGPLGEAVTLPGPGAAALPAVWSTGLRLHTLVLVWLQDRGALVPPPGLRCPAVGHRAVSLSGLHFTQLSLQCPA